MESLRRLVIDGAVPSLTGRAWRLLLTLTILGSTGITILDTVPDFWGVYAWAARLCMLPALALLGLDYGLRLYVAWNEASAEETSWASLRRYALSPYGVFDFLAVAPFMLGEALDMPRDGETVFGILRFLKLARYSPALETLGSVILSEFKPLVSALFIMALLVISTSTLLYFVERADNPGFASVPQAMWWSVVTLATLGYGDVVPATVLGKMLGGVVAILGLCMFALPASILASGFTEEMRRQSFVTNWHLVAKVPFFANLQANHIAEIASVLTVFRAVRGEALMREGDMGESMYFILSGQVEVRSRGGVFVLKAGDFFGEIALLESRPRTATVHAVSRCKFLMLDVRDFRKVMAGHPHLLEAIRETANARLAAQALQPSKVELA